MDLSTQSIKLIILLIPGGLATLLLNRLTLRRVEEPFLFLLSAIFHSLVSYLLLGLVYEVLGGTFSTWGWLTGHDSSIEFSEVTLASLLALLVAVLTAKGTQKRWLNRFGQWLSITDKYGDDTLFMYFLSTKEVNEVYVRNYQTEKVYHGQVASYSDQVEELEVVLRDVYVYNFEGELLYQAPLVYVCSSRTSMTIEVVPVTDDEKTTTD
ncbi:MAG: DUF6338 family protein [Bacteroidia bacterium]|nr:DUF6338 family protein [Bacteroidia bacterium]